MTEDFYTDNAEWYAALVAGTRGELDAAVRDLLGPLPGGAVVDIASGVGSCLPALQDLGAERLFAVEPSRAMRAGLMTTIAHDPELMSRTTIVPMAFPQALEHLPSQWSAGIMFNAIGHLEDSERMMLWNTLRDRLAPGARFVMTLQPPSEVTTLPWMDFGDVAVGEHRIVTRGKADPIDATHVLWTIEWTLLDSTGETLETRTRAHRWRALSRAGVTIEAGHADLVPVNTSEHALVVAFERS